MTSIFASGDPISFPNPDRPRKVLTLAFIRDLERGELLLGLKKRGFGEGNWNGFGGKVELGETIEEGAIRELHEECNASVELADLKEVGQIDFEFLGDPKILEVHVFISDKYSGTISESEEMRPQWYRFEDIPYNKMWPDDREWCPIMLKGQKFKAYYLFQGHGKILNAHLEIKGPL